MVLKKRKEIIVSKEDAVFWMDKNGNFCNEHGKFEHPKIIKYFNSAIRKDKAGYYVHQVSDEFEEKVYFSYEDTALFVLDLIIREEDMTLTLNNGETMQINEGRLFIKDDNLYFQTPEHRIKFFPRALVKISKFLEEKQGQLFLVFNGQSSLVQ